MSNNGHLLAAITAAAGEAQTRLLYCEKCRDTLASDWSENSSYDWCLDLECRGCESRWSVCRACPRVLRHFIRQEQMTRHNNMYHCPKPAAVRVRTAAQSVGETIIQDTSDSQSPDAGVTVDFMVTTDDNWIASFDDGPATLFMGDMPESHTEDRAVPPNTSELGDDGHAPLDFQCFGNGISSQYFKNQNNGHGSSYLVAMSQFNRDNVAPLLEDADVELQMYISFLVDNLTKPQRHHFAEIMTRVVARCDETRSIIGYEPPLMMPGNQLLPSQIKYRCEIPRSYKDIRAWILEGKYSMFQNIPRPSVHKVGDHACVSIHDCIADLLGHGFSLHELGAKGSYTTNVTNTGMEFFSRSQTITENAQRVMGSSAGKATVLWLTSWSDDFEPNYSIKGNRGSVWIKTITIAQPVDSSQSLVYTYPVALGPKGADHDAAERFLLSGLKLFMQAPVPQLYCGARKRMTPVYMESFASLQDQPERRDMLFLARGNATYHARWGYSMDCNALKNVLSPCKTCLESLKKEAHHSITYLNPEWSTGNCDICSCWANMLPSKHLRFPPPQDYPIDKIGEDGLIPAMRLSFPILRQVVEESHEKVLNTSWTDKEAESYLRVHCLSSKAIVEIVAKAKNCSLLEHLQSIGDVNSEEYIAISEDRSICPERYERWQLPALWDDSIPLERYGDVPMHLLFLGVAKSLVLDTQVWLKVQKQHSSFVVYASNVLACVESLQLGWCKVLPYSPGKFGGWVSENYLALVRLFKWIYAPLQQMEVEDSAFIVPETPQRQWNKNVNVRWLRLRGINASGSALEVRDRVAQCMVQPVVPPLLPLRGGSGKQVLRMLNRFADLVCLLMDKHSDECHVRNVEVYVRLFLSEYKEFAEQLYTDRTKNESPAWISRYNFMSLLNLSEQIKEVGPLRTLWEGGTRGEGFLRHVKPQIKTGLKTNWEGALMHSLLLSKSIATLTRPFTTINVGNNSQYRVYTSAAYLERMWQSRKPISIVIKNNVEFMAAYQGTNKVCWMRFLRLAYFTEINEMAYFYFSRHVGAQNFVMDDNAICAMLLPRLATTGLPYAVDESVYSCITNDWRVLVNGSGLFSPISRHSV